LRLNWSKWWRCCCYFLLSVSFCGIFYIYWGWWFLGWRDWIFFKSVWLVCVLRFSLWSRWRSLLCWCKILRRFCLLFGLEWSFWSSSNIWNLPRSIDLISYSIREWLFPCRLFCTIIRRNNWCIYTSCIRWLWQSLLIHQDRDRLHGCQEILLILFILLHSLVNGIFRLLFKLNLDLFLVQSDICLHIFFFLDHWILIRSLLKALFDHLTHVCFIVKIVSWLHFPGCSLWQSQFHIALVKVLKSILLLVCFVLMVHFCLNLWFDFTFIFQISEFFISCFWKLVFDDWDLLGSVTSFIDLLCFF